MGGWMIGILLAWGVMGIAPMLREALWSLQVASVYAEKVPADEAALRRTIAPLEGQLAARAS